MRLPGGEREVTVTVLACGPDWVRLDFEAPHGAVGVAVGLQGFVYGQWLFFSGAVLFVWAAIGLMMESRG